MSILKIVRLGHPALRTKSKLVSERDLKSRDFQNFLDDLTETCVKYNGAGIAAPQVDVNKRVIVVHVDPTNPRYPGQKPFPLTIVINPKVVKKSKSTEEGWEADLSASIKASVPRHKEVVVTGIDRFGNPLKFKLSGFHARVFQHEIDHLDGIFWTYRVKHKETISELPEWEKYWKGKKIAKKM